VLTIKFKDDFKWQSVDMLKYKAEGTHFKDITRQVLFDGQGNLPAQMRYFEIAAGGYSTLERHEHLHLVMILRGSGEALVGTEIVKLQPYDVVHIPALTWHQFCATNNEPFGFLCLVNIERDKPQLPNEHELDALKSDPDIAKFIKN
jgi:quercetin dioxygenase-like cupin family protein